MYLLQVLFTFLKINDNLWIDLKLFWPSNSLSIEGSANMDKKQLFEDYLEQNLDCAYRFAYTYVKNKEDAEDVVSESAIKAMKAINSLKEPQYLKTWFYRIIINTASTHLKKRSRVSFVDDYTIDYMQNAVDDFSHLTVNSLIQSLDEKHRVVIVLRFLEDMKISEIAQILGVNQNTIKTRLYTALKLLKMELEEKDYEAL